MIAPFRLYPLTPTSSPGSPPRIGVLLLRLVCIGLVGLFPLTLLAQEGGGAGTTGLGAPGVADSATDSLTSLPPVDGESTKTVLDVYKEGGALMHILALMLVATVAATIYCFIMVSHGRMVPAKVVERANRSLAQQDVQRAYGLCQDQPSAYTRVLSQALLKVNFERDRANKTSMDEAAADTLDQEETRQMIWVNYLNVFATLAPMLGLLGTVWGMIESFDQLTRGATKPQELAGGISKAMVTTAAGLMVGIPAMFFYFFFRNRLMAIVAEIQKHVSFGLDVLSGEVRVRTSPGDSDLASASGGEKSSETSASGNSLPDPVQANREADKKKDDDFLS